MSGFSEVIGHESIIANLKNSIAAKKVSHAYIFDGPKGIGKTKIANAFAKALQCEEGAADACGRCISCRVFESGNHPDVIYVAATKTKSIGVDDAREQIAKNTETKPYRYKYKIFIVEASDTMTPQAQNALLKTIEEPRDYAVFLFLSENMSQFLPTIVSRCVSFKLRPLSDEAVKRYLRKAGADEESAALYCAYSQGNIGRAAEISGSQAFVEMRAEAISMIQALRRIDLPEIFSLFSNIEKYRENIQDMLDLFIYWYRDVIVMKETGSARHLLQSDKKNEIYAEAQATNLQSLYNKFDAVWQAKRSLKQNSNFQLTIEMMLLALR
ncbi:MAG: DNA polymerase III subunit delta' [Clostridiales bacterium]|jgi:DNA polymerase-3 subunit delta'|nr:DNA polymerase III subunit delta' [Clostridiales bacterium]